MPPKAGRARNAVTAAQAQAAAANLASGLPVGVATAPVRPASRPRQAHVPERAQPAEGGAAAPADPVAASQDPPPPPQDPSTPPSDEISGHESEILWSDVTVSRRTSQHLAPQASRLAGWDVNGVSLGEIIYKRS